MLVSEYIIHTYLERANRPVPSFVRSWRLGADRMGISHPDRETCIEFVDEYRLSMKNVKNWWGIGAGDRGGNGCIKSKARVYYVQHCYFFFLWAPLDNLSCVAESLRTVLSVQSPW